MDRYLNLIESPFDIIQPNITDINIINIINLNFWYCHEYYPEILNMLKENDSCSKDLYYDFYEIKDMSFYIFDYLKNTFTENFKKGNNINFDNAICLLQFINTLLLDFHEILEYKIQMINGELSESEFEVKYNLFENQFNKNHEKYYLEIYQSNSNGMTKSMKNIWKSEVK